MTYKQINIEDLVQDDHNFNKGTEQGAKLIEKSFQDHGAGRSVLLDKDNRLIAGNKATKGAIAAGIKKVRIIETTGDELIAVKRTDISLDSKEGREMALADNATTAVNLSWDQAELESISGQLGIDPSEWDVQLPELQNAVEDEEAQEDNFDEKANSIQVRCKPGDVWQLGEHRLMCGDSIDLESVKTLMGGVKCDLWLTDPPYNVNVANSQGMKMMNDKMISSHFKQFLTQAFKAANAMMTDGCPFYVWFASKEHINFEEALNDNGLLVRQELIWNKSHFILGRSHYQWKHEPCLYGWKGETCRYFIDSRNRASVYQDSEELNIDKMKLKEMRELLHQILEERTPTSILDYAKPNKDDDHPTMKPIKLFGFLITNSSKPGDIVLDSFGGSGTTIIACEQLGRKARVMELDPHYCDVILARWEKFTGKTATKVQPQN